jgi:predicted nucleic acid-binding Zn ribbon protein
VPENPSKKACALCGTIFEAHRPNQKYCSRRCGIDANNAARGTLDLPEKSCPVCQRTFKPVKRNQETCSGRCSKARSNDRARLGDLNRPTAREHEATVRELAQARRELALYDRDFSTKPGWLQPPRDRREHHATLVAFLSDVHAGEVVDDREMRHYNRYDLEICEGRLARFFDRTIVLARHYLAGVKYDGVVLALGGDLVSGDIHEELEQTNETSTYEAVEFLVPRLRAGIEKLAQEFGQLHVVSVPGNHGRDSRKPRAKGRSPHNADTHIAKLIALWLDSEKAITFDVPRSFDVDFRAYDYTFSLEHGDSLRFNSQAEIGAIGTVKRGTLRKTSQAQAEGEPFHYNLIGHFHQYMPMAPQGFVVNGSLKGYDEFARSLHLKPEPAQQALSVVVPEHGVTAQLPVLVQDRKREKW